MKKYLLFILSIIASIQILSAQEFKCQVKVLDNKIQNIDPKVFRTMEKQLTNFLNNQIWTKVSFEPEERIDCNFVITPELTLDDKGTSMRATLAIVANRTVYNTNYKSTIFNYLDRNYAFKYIELQNLQFNEMQINRGDPLEDNLIAELAYYCYMVLGVYFDSFKENSGAPYYDKARNIVNNAPSLPNSIEGWSSQDNRKNSRYWLLDDVQNPRMAEFHTIWYNYHRKMLDNMYNPDFDYSAVLEPLINEFSKLYTGNASSNLVEFFISTKGNEIYDLIANSPSETKNDMASQMSRMHLIRYRDYQKLMNGG